MLTLADIFEGLTGTRPALPDLAISEAVTDSRQTIPGALFIALPGERTDGHRYVGDVFKQGALLALIKDDLSARYPQVDLREGVLPDPFILPPTPFCIRVEDPLLALQKLGRYWRRKMDVRVIGITGSIGKSSTKELTAELLGRRFRTLKNSGNLNNEIGLPLTLLRLGPGYERAVLEMGFFVRGEITFLCDLALPSTGVVTNITAVHAERAGSLDEIAAGKAELIEALPPDGWAVLNHDDPRVRQMGAKTRAKILYYGLDPQAELWADQIEGLGLEGIRFCLHYHDQSFSLRVPLIGKHFVHTVLRAAAVGLVEGLSWDDIVHGLQNSLAQLRLVAVQGANGCLILDDTYNATPESTLVAIDLLGELPGRKLAVLGEMLELGPYEAEGHAKVGARVAEVVDVLVTVGPLGQLIACAAQKAGRSSLQIFSVDEVMQAVPAIKPHLQSGDTVLVKGSHGLRMERIVAALEASA